jgi:hypothetical protein
MTEAFIYDHVRLPRDKGRSYGRLIELTPIQLAKQAMSALRARSSLDTVLIDDVILGCVMPIGEQGCNVARVAALSADYATRARCFAEGVIERSADADLGSILGIGYSSWTGGVLSYIETVGLPAFVSRYDRFVRSCGARFRVSRALRDRAAPAKLFYVPGAGPA